MFHGVRLVLPQGEEAVWPMTPHTEAKHQILEEYLKAWFPILSKSHRRLLYLNGFAGPGVYKHGEYGSPIIAMKTALSHRLAERFGEIVFIFVEKDNRRASKLSEVIRSQFPKLPDSVKYVVRGKEFAPTLESILEDLQGKGSKLAPTFAFLDPFGFSELPMKVVGRLLKCDRCEVLVTFMVGFLNRFAEYQYEQVNELLGTKEWRHILNISNPEEREKQWINLYETQLKNHGATYVRSFQMIGKNNQTVYYLVYATKSVKGMEAMKDAMWKVDRRGTYRFSDMTDPRQRLVMDFSDESLWVPSAGRAVLARFHGQTVDLEAVRIYLITETRFPFRKNILRRMEEKGNVLEVMRRRRRYTYPDGCLIRFA